MPAQPGDGKYHIIKKLVEQEGGTPQPGDSLRDLMAKYLTAIGGTPQPGDTFYNLLVKVVDIKGGTPTPGDKEWDLLVKWLQAEGECRACGDAVHDLWLKVLALGESEPEPSAPEVRVQQGATGITDGQVGAVNFGSVVEGATAPTLTFTVFNDGDADLTLGAVSVPAGYTLTEALAGTITPGNSDTFTVRLDNATPGVKSGNISFSTNDANENPFNFPITGTVVAAFVEVRVTYLNGAVSEEITDGQVSSISFGALCQTQPHITRTFTVHNDGNVNLTTSGLTVPTGFNILNGLAATIPPGGSDTFIVELHGFQPEGSFSGNISFACNDPSENPFNFPVDGEVVNPLQLDSAGPDTEIPWNGIISWFWGQDACPGLAEPTYFGIMIDQDGAGWTDLQFESGASRSHTRASDGNPHDWKMRVAAFDEDFNQLTGWAESSEFFGA